MVFVMLCCPGFLGGVFFTMFCRVVKEQLYCMHFIKAANSVCRSIIQPIFNYKDTAWGNLSIGCSERLQWLQNKAAGLILQRHSLIDTVGILISTNMETKFTNMCLLSNVYLT